MENPQSSDSEFEIDESPIENPNETVLSLINHDVLLVEIETALAQPNVQIYYQSTINGSFLYAAIRKRRVDIVRLLISKGVDVTAKISKIKNKTPLKLVNKLLKTDSNNNDLKSIKELLEDSQPGPSAMDSKGIKRKAEHSNNQIQTADPVAAPMGIPSKRLGTDNEYNASGLKLSFHGVVFQVKLLMLFIHRAIRNGYEFRLATEMDRAEKFDDIVFEYSKPNDPSKRSFSFVQAKHRIDCDKSKITMNSLKSEDDDFSLQKYFISFCKIKRNSHFRDSKSNKYFIVTNTDFDFIGKKPQNSNELIDKWRQFIQQAENLCTVEILYFKTGNFKAEMYKLGDNSEGELKKIMKQNLLNSALETKKIKELKSAAAYLYLVAKQTYLPDVNRLSEKLICLEKENELRRVNKKRFEDLAKEALELYENIFSGKVVKDHIESLMEEALELKKKNLDEAKNKLIKHKHSETIPIETQKKDVLKATGKLLKMLSVVCNCLKNDLTKFEAKNSYQYKELERDKQILKEDETKLKKIMNPSDSTEAKRLLENVREASVIDVSLDNAKFDELFDEFIQQFRIVTNYPNESELGALIGDELGDDLNLLNADLANASFEQDAFNILKDYKGGKALFHNTQDAIDGFNKIKKHMAGLMISGLCRSYPQKLKQYGIQFNKAIAELDRFLEPESETQIFQLITQSTRLGAIKVLQSLDASGKYEKSDSLIFMRLRTLLRVETQQQIINCVTNRQTYNLIVIEIQNKNREEKEDKQIQLYCDLRIFLQKIFTNDPCKKVIVIDSAKRLYNFKSETKEEQIAFEDLEEPSRKKILEKEVNFQGNNVKLKRLIDPDQAEKVLDHLILSNVLENGLISIGDQKAFFSIDYIEDCYVERKFDLPAINEDIVNEQLNRFIGADQAEKVLDHLILSNCLENGQTSIGNQKTFSSIGYIEDCYVERKFDCLTIYEDIILKKSTTMKFFITGADIIDLRVIGANPENIIVYPNGRHHTLRRDKRIIIPSSDQSNQDYLEIFENLDDVVHWLHYFQSRLFWIYSKTDSIELVEFIEDDKRLDCNKRGAPGGIFRLDEWDFAKRKGLRTVIIANDVVKDCYVERKFHRPAISVDIIFEKSTTMRFFITGADRRALRMLGANPDNIIAYKNGQCHDKGIIIPSSDQSYQDYLEIFQNLDDDVHWLHYSQLRLFWIYSKTDSVELVNFIENEKRLDCDEEGASDGNFRTVIIANDAGMGKSTVLTSLATKMRQLDYNTKEPTNYRWIIRINLNDFADKAHESCLKYVDFDEHSTSEAIEYVTKMAIPGDPTNDLIIRLQRKIFKLSLKESSTGNKTPKIVLMFDGFDEITPFYKEKTTTLIKALQASNVSQIWISTRVHERLHLEQKLNSRGFVMLPLSDLDQVKFTNKLWKWQLKFKTNLSNGAKSGRSGQDILNILNGIQLPDEWFAEQLNGCISKIVDDFGQNDYQIELEELKEAIDRLDFSKFFGGMICDWKGSIKDDSNKFTINPLQLKMLTEVVFAENFQIPKDFGLSKLYEKFMEMKFYITFTEKGKLIEGNQMADGMRKQSSKESYKVYEALAVVNLFPKNQNSLPNLSVLDRFESINEEKEKLHIARSGILVLNEGRLEFIHKSFAEFFLSKYLIDNLRDRKVQELLLPQILFDRNYKVVRDFFNKQLEHAKIGTELSETSMNLINDRLTKNKFSFISSIKDDQRGISKIILEAVQSNVELLEELLRRPISKRKKIMYYVIRNNNYELLEQLLWASLRLKPMKIKKFILGHNQRNGGRLLGSVIKFGRSHMIKIILEFVKKNQKYLGNECLRHCVPSKHFLEQSKTEIIKCEFIKQVRDIFGMNHVFKLFYSNDMAFDDYSIMFMECIQVDTEIFTDFVLESNEYGNNRLLGAMKLSLTSKLLKEFVAILCEQLDPNILEDLAIILVYCHPYYHRDIGIILKIVNSNSVMHAKLVSIQDNRDKIEQKSKRLYTAIKNKNFNEFNNILEKCNPFEAKQVLMNYDNDYDRRIPILHEAIRLNHCKIIDQILESIKVSEYISLKCLLRVHFDNETPLHLAVKLDHRQIVLKLMEFMKDHVGVSVLTRVLSRMEAVAHSFNRIGRYKYEYIFQWIEKNMGARFLNTFIESNEIIEPTALALETNYFRQTYFTNRRYVSNLKKRRYKSYLENIKNQSVVEDLVILSVYADARTDPCENIDKLFENDFFGNEPRMQKILDKIKSSLKDVHHRKCALDDAIRNGEKDTVIGILVQDENVIKELVLISNANGQTALHLAAELDSSDIIRVLLEKVKKYPRILEEMAVKINPMNGETALHVAARHDHQRSVLVILDFLRDHRDILTKLLLRPHNEYGLSVIADKEINQCILEWMRENLNEYIIGDLILEANLLQLIDLSNANTVLSSNIRKLKNLKNYPEMLLNVIEKTHDTCDSLLSDLADFHKKHLARTSINEFLQIAYKNIKDSDTIEDLAIISVFESAQIDPKTNINHLLNEVGVKNFIPEMCNILMKIEGFMNEIQQKWSRLNDAVLLGDKEQVQSILYRSEKCFQKALLLMHNKRGQTLLHVATERNQSQIVEILLETARNYRHIFLKILVSNFEKSTALQRAAELGYHETVLIFLNCFKNLKQNELTLYVLEKQRENLIKSLKIASARKHHQTVKVILEFTDEHSPINSIDHHDTILKWAEEHYDEIDFHDIAPKLFKQFKEKRGGMKRFLFRTANKVKLLFQSEKNDIYEEFPSSTDSSASEEIYEYVGSDDSF